MKKLVMGITIISALAVSGIAYEYPLQFTPAAGARGLVVAGYQDHGCQRHWDLLLLHRYERLWQGRWVPYDY